MVLFNMEFSALPTEVQFQIFNLFNSSELQQFIAPVCKRWHAIASEPILWTSLKFVNGKHEPQQVVQTLKHSLFLHNVKFIKFHDFSWTEQLQEYTSTEYLAIESCQINGGIMMELARLFPNVQYIHIRIGRDSIRQIPKFKQIKAIYMWVKSGIDGNEFLNLFSTNCENLCSFHVPCASKITDTIFTKFLDAKGVKLTQLTLSGLERLTPPSYDFVAKCPGLTFLVLMEAKNMNDFHLANLQNLENLNSLWLFYGDNLFSSENFCTLFKDVTFHRLDVLKIVDCANLIGAKLHVLIQCCPRLHYLMLGYLDNLVDEDFVEIAGDCKELEKLTLHDVKNITEDCLISLIGKFPRIACITARECPEIRGSKNIRIDVRRDFFNVTFAISEFYDYQ